MNALFTPFSIGVGLAAGQLAKKLFQALWGRFADADAPKPKHRETLRTLGLKRIHDVVVKEDRPEIRGMVAAVPHLVAVEEVE